MALRSAAHATRLHPATSNDACSCSYAVQRCRDRRPLTPVTPRFPGLFQRWIARSSSHEEMYERLFNSPVFRSDLVMNEFNNIVKEATQLSGMAGRFPDFDLQGKQMYLDKMQEMSDRYEIFIKRLELSQDPAAKEYLRTTNAQMLEGGFTLNQMFAGLKQSVAEYRKWVEQEERVSGDPVAHQEFLKYFREMWGASVLGRLDLSYLVKTTDPQVILKAQNDPQFWVMLKEISTSPSPAAMAKWMDHPTLGPLVAELWKSTQKGQ